MGRGFDPLHLRLTPYLVACVHVHMCGFPDLHTSTPHSMQSQVSLTIQDLEIGDKIFSWLLLLVPWDISQVCRPLAVGPTSEALVLHSVFSLLTHFRAFGWLVCGVRGKILARHLLNKCQERFYSSYCSRGERLQYRTELNSEDSSSLLLMFDQSLNPDYSAS